MKLWLIGMMGAGKTSAGMLAASRLGVRFMDTDELVAMRESRSIPDLWSEMGEASFRASETLALTQAAEADGIVATGGGVVLSDDNREVMKRSGTIVWLQAAPSTLLARLGGAGHRPLLTGPGDDDEATLELILAERSELYAELADHLMDTNDLDLAETARRIEDIWKS